MSQQVTVKVHVAKGSHGRQRIKAGTAPPPPRDPEEVPRVARVLALAHKWDELIKSGAVRDRASLARLVGVSRARITQVMTLLWLAPDVQEAVLFGEVPEGVTERELRGVAANVAWSRQVQLPSEVR